MYLIEVDVHALELEVRGAIVPSPVSRACPLAVFQMGDLHAGAIETVLARDGLPARLLGLLLSSWARAGGSTHQKAAPIWLPYSLSEASQ